MLKISELQTKDVVNIGTGRRLGHFNDLDINLETGQINSLVIGGSKMMGFFSQQKSAELIIPWRHIVKCGSDCILVNVHEDQ